MNESKPRMVPLTNSDEIASVQKNELYDIIGEVRKGACWAYEWSVKRWRAERLTQNVPGSQHD
jgi:hypothetical protein